MRKLIRRARLSSIDRQIAISRLVWEMDYVDIGEAVHLHRTAVSTHMRKKIAPKLLKMIAHNALVKGA